MSPAPDPPFESQPQGISLDELAEAFAQVMGTPRARRPVAPASRPCPSKSRRLPPAIRQRPTNPGALQTQLR